MKHTVKSRPGLPSTTPSPICKSDIITSSFPRTNDVTNRQMERESPCLPKSSAKKYSLQSNNLSRLSHCQGLDVDDISDVGSHISEDLMLHVASSKTMQLDAIRFELSKKTKEAEMILESIQLAYTQMKVIDNNSEKLRETILEMDRVLASKQRSAEHLISINMTLIDTLAALGLQPSSDKGMSKQMIRQRSDTLPMIKTQTDGVDNSIRINNDDIYATNGKLKECLLVMSREYYGSKKSMKAMFGVYEDLRSALRVVDQKNRYHMKLAASPFFHASHTK